MTTLMQEERIGPGDIDSVQVHLPTRSARTVDNAPMPDVNVQHLLAMLLIDGELSFHTIHDRDRMQIPEILALRRRITIIPSEELMHARPRRQAIVDAKMRDGRTLSRRTHAVRGSADNPMTQTEVEAKAFDLIGSVLGARRARAIVRAIAQLETLPDVTALRRLWQPSTNLRVA
jgi:2-methylcitrate dehydratase PrpD